MFGRVRRAIGLVLLAVVATTAAPARAQASRIVAVGDLHGDYEAYDAILRAAGLVDRRGRWAGGRTVFVQTGDVPDRGPDSLRILRHLIQLQRQAARAGGRVVALVGNHEAMNVTGDLRYVHPGEFAAFADRDSARRRDRIFDSNRSAIEAAYRARRPGMTAEAIRLTWMAATPLGWVEHRAAWAPDGEIGRWVLRNPAVALIDGSLFVHGGISAAYAPLPIDEINRRVAAALAARDSTPGAIVNDPLGPLWYRGLALRGAEAAAGANDGAPAGQAGPPGQPLLSIDEEIDLVLRAYGASRIVIGHTPVLDGIALLHGGRLIRIDTGISAPYRGRRTWLEIVDGRVTAHVVGEPGR
jgi:hypothetical protein